MNRETAVLLGGGRALVLQVAHPLVAAGVAAHSRFRAEPLARLWSTLDLMLTIVFGDASAAQRAVERITQVHARVRGTLGSDVQPFAAGTPYQASDPGLLLWVHATLVDSTLVAYERFVGPLDPAARSAYYAESSTVARLFGIPAELVPPTATDFARWMEEQLDALPVGPQARDIAAAVLDPPVPLVTAPAFRLTRFVTIGLLPPVVRARFGLAWDARAEARLDRLARVIRRTVPRLPRMIRLLPHARRAGA